MAKHLFTPGPVTPPAEVVRAETIPLTSHREPDYSYLLLRLQNRLKDLLDADGPVVLLPSSGTGALETLAVNLLDRGDKVLSVSCGAFGERFREIASRTGAEIVPVDVPVGQAVSPALVRERLEATPGVTALLLTHNETSTGVTNDIGAIVAALPEERPLLLVDAVSSLGAMPCEPQNWGVDALASTTQKGLITPPGVGVVWLSPRGWRRVEEKGSPSYYFDLALHRKYLEKDLPENPYTPPVSLFSALDAALGFLADLGHSVWFDGRRRFARSLCAGAEAMGLVPLVEAPEARSSGVTALMVPDGKGQEMRNIMRALGVEVAGGQGTLRGKIVRVAHYSDTGWPEVAMVLGCLYGAALDLGLEPRTGFIEKAFLEWKAETR